MKTTPFTKYHIANGAKMSEFAGYNMPIEFTGINEEHLNVREKAGVFDVSHMGEIWIKGPKALDFLQRITSNNVAALTDGKVQYTTMPNGRGGIVDDLLVYRIDAEIGNVVIVFLRAIIHASRFLHGRRSDPAAYVHCKRIFRRAVIGLDFRIIALFAADGGQNHTQSQSER